MTQIGVNLPQPLERVRQYALNEINQAMQTLFDKADGWLFEQADSIPDPKSQQMYMELIRLLRSSRKSILSDFISLVSGSFRELRAGGSSHDDSPDFGAVSVSQLSLVGHQEMDHSVALDGMAARASRDADLALKLLTARFNHLLSQSDLSDQNNPLSPKQLCSILGKVVKDTGWETPHQLVFFKLFQMFVLNGISGLIDDCNKLLEKDGVLQGKSELEILRVQGAIPSFRHQGIQSDANSLEIDELQDTDSAATLAVNASSAPPRDWSVVLSGALASLQQPNALGLPISAIGSSLPNALPVGVDVLAGMLSQLQSEQLSQQGHYLPPAQVVAELDRLMMLRPPGNTPERVDDVDANVINLVSLLFDQVLSDTNLSEHIKSVLGRLQFPYLRLAVSDPAFLSSSSHPARCLINLLAQVGARQNDSQSHSGDLDLVHDKIQWVVDSLLQCDALDEAVFTATLESFEAFVEQHERRSQLMAQRVASMEEGRARNQQAKEAVKDALQSLVGSKEIPEVMAAFIADPWSAYLCWLFHNKGKESSEWSKGIYAVQQMMFCLELVASDEEAEDRQIVIEDLLSLLRQGCATISYVEPKLNKYLGALSDIFTDRARFVAPVRGATEEPEPVKDRVTETIERLRAPRIPKDRSSNKPIDDKVAILDISSKLADKPMDVEPQLPPLDEGHPSLKAAEALGVGAWLEYLPPDGAGKVRCKLAANIKAIDKLIFVNSAGAKLFDKNLLAVAHDIKDGRLKALDDNLLFDRALENVISSLRDVRSKAG